MASGSAQRGAAQSVAAASQTGQVPCIRNKDIRLRTCSLSSYRAHCTEIPVAPCWNYWAQDIQWIWFCVSWVITHPLGLGYSSLNYTSPRLSKARLGFPSHALCKSVLEARHRERTPRQLPQAVVRAPATHMLCVRASFMRVGPERPQYGFAAPALPLGASIPKSQPAEQLPCFAALHKAVSRWTSLRTESPPTPWSTSSNCLRFNQSNFHDRQLV